jgi:integrase/recombinase XerD
MKPLAVAAEDYLALRRSLGFKLYHLTWWLPDFVSYVERHGSSVITTELALGWAQQPPDADPNWWAKKLGAIRCFAQHHRAFDPRTEVPPADLLPCRQQRLVPHLYTDDEVASLMREAGHLRSLTAATYTTLVGLLAATGMRLGEAIAFEDDDVDWRHALLTVRDSKFRKSRQVPVHVTTLQALRAYVAVRDRLRPVRESSTFLVSCAGTKLFEQNVWCIFARLRQRAGLLRPGRRAPRIHDLRHTFAVKTITQWYRDGVDVERRLPWLSTYLGHVCPASTYWYLTATPELIALASERAERAWKVRL